MPSRSADGAARSIHSITGHGGWRQFAQRARDACGCVKAELASQSRTLNFILEWSGFLLSAFGAYMLSFGVGMSGMWTAWAAWLAANVVGACFAIRNRHYGLALQSIVFMPSSMKGLITALQLAG